MGIFKTMRQNHLTRQLVQADIRLAREEAKLSAADDRLAAAHQHEVAVPKTPEVKALGKVLKAVVKDGIIKCGYEMGGEGRGETDSVLRAAKKAFDSLQTVQDVQQLVTALDDTLYNVTQSYEKITDEGAYSQLDQMPCGDDDYGKYGEVNLGLVSELRAVADARLQALAGQTTQAGVQKKISDVFGD